MAVLSLNNISKSYGTDIILKDITFTINENDKIGMVGKNGAGKTTLFKIICGELKPDSGEIFIAKDIKLGYLSQNLNLNDDSTVFEEVMKVFEDILKIEKRLHELEIEISEHSLNSEDTVHEKLLNEYGQLQEEFERKNGYGCQSFAKGILIGLGISEPEFNKQIKLLSGGQKTRVALSKMLLQKPDILLLDEPTNHLDLDAIDFLENFLKDYKGTVIIISHDRFFLDVITNKTYEMVDGTVEEYSGNYTYFVNERETRYEQRVKDYTLQQSEIKRMEEIIQKYRSFNREKSIKQAESREKSLNKIERIEKPTLDNKSARMLFDIRVRSGNDVLMIENLSKHYGEKKLFEDISFMLRREEKVALIGENGRGKTTIFKIIMDSVKADSGYVRLGKNVYIGYYDQEQKNLSPEKTIIDELWDEYPSMTSTQIRNYLAAFLFTGDDVFKEVSKLSGGEKCRISLLKLMLSSANLLLLDEPTNHLDILSREALEKSLLEYPGTLFVISHDRYFLNKIINKMYELNVDGITEYLGNYQYYISKKNAPKDEIVVDTAGKTKTEIKEERKKLREIQEMKKQSQNEIKQIEKAIETIELDISKLEEQLCLEEVYSNSEKSIEINNNLKELKDKMNDLYENWEKLSIESEE